MPSTDAPRPDASRTTGTLLADARAIIDTPGAQPGLDALFARAAPVFAEVEGRADTGGAAATLAQEVPRMVDLIAIEQTLREGLARGQFQPRELMQLADDFKTMGEAGTRTVFERLTPDETRAFGEAIVAVSYGTAVGSSETARRLFASFASSLGSADLLALAEGAANGPSPQAAVDFGQEVAVRTPLGTKAGLVTSGASQLDETPALAPVLAGALAGMGPHITFDETVNAIGVDKLTDILRGSVVSYMDLFGGTGPQTSTWAARGVAENMRAYNHYETPPDGLSTDQETQFRREQSAMVRAEVVLALGEIAGEIPPLPGDASGAPGRVLDGAVSLFESDALFIAGQLEQQLDPTGRRTTNLVDGLLATDRQEAAGRLYGAVVTDGGRSSSADVMSDVQAARPWLHGDQDQFANARAAGHLYGAVNAALRNSADAFAGDQRLTKNLIQTAAGVASVGGPYVGVPAAIVAGLTDEATARIATEQSRRTYETLDEIVSDTVAPRVPNRDSDGDGLNDRATGDWITDYNAARGAVLDSRPR